MHLQKIEIQHKHRHKSIFDTNYVFKKTTRIIIFLFLWSLEKCKHCVVKSQHVVAAIKVWQSRNQVTSP